MDKGIKRPQWYGSSSGYLSGLILFFYATTLWGATASTTLSVSATVLTDCIVVATPLAFGGYDPTSQTDLDATASVSVTCTLAAPFNIGLDAGTGAGANVTVRKMTAASGTLNYGIYQNSARSVVLGNTIGVDTIANVGTGILQLFNVYGRIPSGQAAQADAYSDTVTVTVTF